MKSYYTFFKINTQIICVQTSSVRDDNMLVGSGDDVEEAVENLESAPFSSSDPPRDGAEWLCDELSVNKSGLKKINIELEDEDEDDDDDFETSNYHEDDSLMPLDNEW